jgi:hypothetical protein
MRRREIMGAMAISDALGFWPVFAPIVTISSSQHNAEVRRASVLGPRPNVTPYQRSQPGFCPRAVHYASNRKPRLDRFFSLDRPVIVPELADASLTTEQRIENLNLAIAQSRLTIGQSQAVSRMLESQARIGCAGVVEVVRSATHHRPLADGKSGDP